MTTTTERAKALLAGITPEERAELRRIHDLNRYSIASPTILRLLDALDAEEARIDELEDWGCRLVFNLTDGKMSKLYDVGVIVDEVSDSWNELVREEVAKSENRAAELERQRDKLAHIASANLCLHYNDPKRCRQAKNGEPFSCYTCWLEWAAGGAQEGEE